MATLSLTDKIVDSYFNFLKNFDVKAKKRLILKLEESIENDTVKKFDNHAMAGAWIDDRTSDEIIEDIRSSRIDNSDSIDL